MASRSVLSSLLRSSLRRSSKPSLSSPRPAAISRPSPHGVLLNRAVDYATSSAAQGVLNTGSPITVPVGRATLDPIINVIGEPIDERGDLKTDHFLPIHREAPSFVDRFATSTGPCRGCKPDGTQLGFGRYGIKSCRAGRITNRAIEAARRAIIGQFNRALSRRNSKIWVRVIPDIPITRKPTEVRMGRGKGKPTGDYNARVSTGQILFEMDGVTLSTARQAAALAAHKLCLSTKFVQWS